MKNVLETLGAIIFMLLVLVLLSTVANASPNKSEQLSSIDIDEGEDVILGKYIVFHEYNDTVWDNTQVEIVTASAKTGKEYKQPKVRVPKYGNACRNINKSDLELLKNGINKIGIVYKNYANGERKITKIITKK